MAHQFQEHRQHKVEKRRVGHILGRKSGGRVGSEEDSSYESDGEIEADSAHRGDRGDGVGKSPSRRRAGGHVSGQRKKHRMDRRGKGGHAYAKGGHAHGDEAEDRALFRKMMREERGKPHRAKGGRTKKGKTHITINVGQHGQPPAPAAMPALPPPPPRPMMPPGPPPGPPPGLGGAPPMGGLPPGLPPGMPPPGLRKRGGRAVKNASNAIAPARDTRRPNDAGMPLSGAPSTPGDRMPPNPPGWTESARHKTPVQHTDGKIDGPDIGRGKPITYHRGGTVKNASNAIRTARPIPGAPATVSRASPTVPGNPARVSAAEPTVPMAKAYPLKAGSKSGLGRLEKARAGARGHNVP